MVLGILRKGSAVKHLSRGILLLTAILIIAWGGARGEDLSAKATLVQARSAARRWRSDAVLIRINTARVSADGASNQWSYGFYSPAARNCLLVILADGRVADTTESGGAVCAEPELGEFMDSDRAMRIARTNGFKTDAPTMGLLNTPTAGGNRTVWLVYEGTRPGEESVMIDARTGEVLEKTRIP